MGIAISLRNRVPQSNLQRGASWKARRRSSYHGRHGLDPLRYLRYGLPDTRQHVVSATQSYYLP